MDGNNNRFIIPNSSHGKEGSRGDAKKKDKNMIAGILLAAGNSSRMGEPKALLSCQGLTFADSILNKLAEINCNPVITILGSSGELIRRQTKVDSFQCFNNPNPELGQLSSLKIAIEKLPDQTKGFILTLVDHPLVKLETYQALYQKAKDTPDCIIIPRFGGRRGHPVYFGERFFISLLEAPLNKGARTVVYENIEDVKYIESDDEGILKDIDTQGDYLKIKEGVEREAESGEREEEE